MFKLQNPKKFLISFSFVAFIFLGIFFVGQNFVFAQNKNVEITFFYSPTCQHCLEEEKFLDNLKNDYSWINIKSYEFSKNISLAINFYEDYNVPSNEQGLVPLTFIDDKYFVGFNEQIGEQIKNYILKENGGESQSNQNKIAELPILGKINIENISFPALAMIFGFFDGFNVCSLGALVLILGLVLTFNSRKKILIFGGLYVLVTALVYWLMIFFWHRLFIFVSPYLRNMEIIIGLLAGVGGWYLFREYLKARKNIAVCRYGGISEKLAGKVNEIFEKKSGIFVMILAVLLFAGAITIIEFPCSAFFPLLFSGMLAESGVSFSLSMFYIGIFIFFYMLDELIVLVVATSTLKIWMGSPKTMKWLNLAGSLMLFVFGFYYLLWPILKTWFNL